MKLLITGVAGFIGFHVVKKLLSEADDFEIIGLDNISDYYDTDLKYARLNELGINRKQIDYNKLVQSENYSRLLFIKLNLEDKANIIRLFEDQNFDYVCHFAAQAGVRYSMHNPDIYIQSNIVGFLNILEACRNNPVQHLLYATSSSVYGMNEKVPFVEDDNTDSPVSLYAATKKSNELMAHTYSHLYKIPTTGLRFFTVYGPWGRPDMAPFLFTQAIADGQPIKVFNQGNMWRDFTYIDDIVEGVVKTLKHIPSDEQLPYTIYNIGNSQPVKLMDFISELEAAIGKQAEKIYLPMQPGDVYQTYADTSRLEKAVGFKPRTSIRDGVKEFVKWYKQFYHK